ncbi:MAG: DUF2490 domain-containing protein [Chitinophagaceae bacterium]|nr:DUF2490 domain-containing protein [Chitinophagaceae bacterium]
MKATGILLVLVLFAHFTGLKAQNSRKTILGKIGWYNYFGTFQLSDKWGIHTEYQWRRDAFITDWQQSLLRVGLNYQPVSHVLFRMGYGWIETFDYGEIPLNVYGKTFTEHRLFEAMQLTHRTSGIDFLHRIMLEQRFVGKYETAFSDREESFPLLHRMRYMFRAQVALKGKVVQDRTPYAAFYDEIFMGFGKNVQANIFDQNRISFMLGYRFNPLFRIEAGYLNQIVQFGRIINGQNIFQYNHGCIINANLSLDLRKSQTAQ